MLLPSLKLLQKERVMISCDDCAAGVYEFPNNSIPVFIHTFLGVENEGRKKSKEITE